MQPDNWMPFYGSDFFQAVEGRSELVANAYLRAIWHYWSHEHCQGLENDSELLRRLCRVDREDWPAVETVVFDNDKFFTLGQDGKWHQKRCSEIWQQAEKKYAEKCRQTSAATAARWKPKQKRTN